MNLTIRTVDLPCGLKLLLAPQPGATVATADVWVGAGAADEPDRLAGVSHFLEHMLFKGAGRWGLGEIERAIELDGGVCNAGTSFDFTHFYVTLPGHHLSTAIEALAAMVTDAALDDGELQKERGVILEEYRRKQDHPAALLFEQLYCRIFETGPYHTPVIGTEKSIRSIDREGMLEYYREQYHPANMTMILTGRFDEAAAIEAAQKAFEGFKYDTNTPIFIPTSITARRLNVHLPKRTGGEHYVAFACAAPGMDTPGKTLALDAAQYILGQGRASKLYQELKEKRGLCSSITTYFPNHREGSVFVVFATCEPGRRKELRNAIVEQLNAFAQDGPTQEELMRARRLLASSHLFSMETSSGLAGNIGYLYTLTGSNTFLETYLDRLENLQPEEARDAIGALAFGGDFSAFINEISVGPEAKS